MKHSFAIAFMLVGLPILFIIREYIPINKVVFTYAIVGLNLLTLVNYSNLFKLKFYFKISFLVQFFCFVILGLFTIVALFENGLDSQSVYLLIIIYLFLSLYTIRGQELSQVYKFVLILSSIAIYMAFFLTPTNPEYWFLHGSRFYLGDTKNPGLVSSLTAINLISIIFYLFSKERKALYTIMLIPLLGISPYLYYLSQGKSTILGLFSILLYLIYSTNRITFVKALVKYKYKIIFIIGVLLVFSLYLGEYILNFSNLILNTGYSLVGIHTDYNVMSASIRNDNFEKSLDYMSVFNIFGHGINTFRMDSPILQTAVDFGNIMAILFFFISVFYPLSMLVKINYSNLDINTKLIVLVYIFYFQNYLFHGAPYEYSIWLPLLIFYKLISSYRTRL